MTRVEFEFDDNSDNEANFNLYRSQSSPVEATSANLVKEPSSSSGTGTVRIADTTADVGVTYYYAMSAENSAGESALSNEIQVTTTAVAMSEANVENNTQTVTVDMSAEASTADSTSMGQYVDISISTRASRPVTSDATTEQKSISANRLIAHPSATVLQGYTAGERQYTQQPTSSEVSAEGDTRTHTETRQHTPVSGSVSTPEGQQIHTESFQSQPTSGDVDSDGFKIPTGNFRSVRVYVEDGAGNPINNAEWVQTRGLFPTAAPVNVDSEGRAYASMWLLREAYDDLHVVADSGIEGVDYVWYQENPGDIVIGTGEREVTVMFNRMRIEQSGGGGGITLGGSGISLG